ncbi:MAG: polynucleotide adenylyltransferase PcnB [Chromatiales bacterium]
MVSSAEQSPPSPSTAPGVLARSEHPISRANISSSALKVLYRLKDAGYSAYLVGGGVRDLLLGREPKDFDVATDARPEDVRRLFRNCRLIGRRFRLAHVRFGREIIEVATFRAPHDTDPGEGLVEGGRIIRDNVYGTIEQDALRRDFTINALYYDIRDFSVVDYAGALQDLEHGVLRLIGDPEVRYREDPVRMLRAVRFAAKLGFRIHPDSESPIYELGGLLSEIAPARLFDEVIKLFHGGAALQSFELLRHYDLFAQLFPMTEESLAHEEQGFPLTFVSTALSNTDERVNIGKPVTPAFLFAVLLWEPVRHRARGHIEAGLSELEAIQLAGAEVVAEQAGYTAIPKRFSMPMREIWALQPRFRQRSSRRVQRLLAHPQFRAAYDFLCLQAQCGEALQDDCDWWTRIQEVSEAEQREMVQAQPSKRRRRRRRRPAKDLTDAAGS